MNSSTITNTMETRQIMPGALSEREVAAEAVKIAHEAQTAIDAIKISGSITFPAEIATHPKTEIFLRMAVLLSKNLHTNLPEQMDWLEWAAQLDQQLKKAGRPGLEIPAGQNLPLVDLNAVVSAKNMSNMITNLDPGYYRALTTLNLPG